MIESNLLSLSYGRIVSKDIGTNVGLLPESFETYQVIESDDLVFRLTDLQNDKRSLRSAVVPHRGIITSAYLSVRPTNIVPKFLAYTMRDADLRKVFYSMGGGLRQSMKFDDMKRLAVVFPSVGEQLSIVNFLDRETAEIDAFIADQEELITLLAERRTATITQAVTKGLHPDVRMVEGSLTEISFVPIHWSVSRLKWGIAKIESGTSVNAHDVPVRGADEVGVLKTSCVYTGEFDPSKNKKVNVEDLNRVACPVQANTLIVSRMNTPQLVGAAGYVVRNEPNIYLPDRLWQVYFHDSWEARFVHFWTQTRLYRAQVEAACMGTSSSMQNIGQDDLRNFILHLPPKDEQREIVDYLKTATSDIDAAIADAREAIALSQERRAAVISAAVTGKIDVRGLVGPEANDVEGVSVGIA
ncbi:restriction endonuclease subunit S [Glutamicibacter ardleyensis]|uniref:restriction endonuclease subunit S n=1 Tax=Glutamicibacter ardleyensis TaxID=225894 RepID=UPI003F909FD4